MSQPHPLVRPAAAEAPAPAQTSPGLGRTTVVLVGLMGVGKTTVGRGLAAALKMPFRDADEEIERAAGRSIADIFAERGEAEFRDGERRVIARLLTQEPAHVLALGGGAFVNAETRALAHRQAITVWLKADLDVLARRVSRRNTRPLLIGKDPRQVLGAHADARYPAYGLAQVTVETAESSSVATVAAVVEALSSYLASLELRAVQT